MAAAAGPLYRLADYLDQHGRAHRASQIPPAEFWSAAAAHAAPGDQAALGDAAHARGLYRDAAQLHKNAAASGNPRAALYLSHPPACLRADPRPAHWAAAHAALDDPRAWPACWTACGRRARTSRPPRWLARDRRPRRPRRPGGVASLLDSLREAGADEQAAALLARDPAAHAPLDDPAGVARLLDSLREAGARRAGRRAGRPGRRPRRPRRPGRRGQPAGQPAGGGRGRAGRRAAGPAAAHAPLDNPDGVASLLDSLREAGAHEQAAALAARAAAHAALDDPAAWPPAGQPAGGGRARAGRRAAGRTAAHAALDNPAAWPACWTACGRRARTSRPPRWPARAAAHAPLDDPDGVASLLDSLREAGAHEQAAALPARDPPPTPPSTTRTAWPACWTACGRRARTSRPPRCRPAPPPTPPSTTRAAWPACWTACGRRARTSRPPRCRPAPAAHAPLDNPAGVARLLDSLREAGAHEQAAALAGRAAAHAPLDDPDGVASLLDSLREAGAHEQAAALAGPGRRPRRPRRPGGVASLLDSLREAGAHEQAAALAGPRPPPTPPSTTRAAWPACWTACGRRARTSRPPRWPAGCRRPACSGSSSSRKAPRISSVSDGRPTAPRPRHGAGKTWTYGLFPDRGDREATLPVGLPPTRRIRKVSLDSSLSGRPELHCEAQLSAPAPRSLHSDRTPFARLSFPRRRLRCPGLVANDLAEFRITLRVAVRSRELRRQSTCADRSAGPSLAAAVGCRTRCLQSVGRRWWKLTRPGGRRTVVALESTALSLAKTIVQKAAGAWIADRLTAEERKKELTALLTPRFRHASPEQRFLDEAASDLASFSHEFRGLDDGDREAALLAVRDAFERADLTDRALFAVDLDAAKLASRLRAGQPRAKTAAGLGEAGGAFYDAALDRCCELYVRAVVQVPAFVGRSSAEILSRLSDLPDQVADRVDQRLAPRLRQRSRTRTAA